MTWPLVKPASGYRTFSRLVSLSVRPSIWTSTSVLLATFTHHLDRRLVRPQSLQFRRPQLLRVGAFQELELSHQIGFRNVRSFGPLAACAVPVLQHARA